MRTRPCHARTAPRQALPLASIVRKFVFCSTRDAFLLFRDRNEIWIKTANTIHFIVRHQLSDVVLWNWANLISSASHKHRKPKECRASFNLLCILFITILHIVLSPSPQQIPIQLYSLLVLYSNELRKIYYIELHMFASHLSTHC